MSDPIGPGDWVECVDADLPFPLCPIGLDVGIGVYVGRIYRVREVVRGRYADGRRGDGLRLEGVFTFDKCGAEGAYIIEMFRPVYRPKQSIIEALKVSELIGEGERSEVRVSQKDNA